MPSKDWKNYRREQQKRRERRMPQRRNEILKLRFLGYQVRELYNAHPNGIHFHVSGVGGTIMFWPLHRNYATHGNRPQYGQYWRPSDVMAKFKIKPFPKEEKQHEEAKQIGPEPNAEVRGFKPARSYWSWRKHFGPGVGDSQRPADPGAAVDEQPPDQHPAAAAAECVPGPGQREEAAADSAGSAPARAGVGQ